MADQTHVRIYFTFDRNVLSLTIPESLCNNGRLKNFPVRNLSFTFTSSCIVSMENRDVPERWENFLFGSCICGLGL